MILHKYFWRNPKSLPFSSRWSAIHFSSSFWISTYNVAGLPFIGRLEEEVGDDLVRDSVPFWSRPLFLIKPLNICRNCLESLFNSWNIFLDVPQPFLEILVFSYTPYDHTPRTHPCSNMLEFLLNNEKFGPLHFFFSIHSSSLIQTSGSIIKAQASNLYGLFRPRVLGLRSIIIRPWSERKIENKFSIHHCNRPYHVAQRLFHRNLYCLSN